MSYVDETLIIEIDGDTDEFPAKIKIIDETTMCCEISSVSDSMINVRLGKATSCRVYFNDRYHDVILKERHENPLLNGGFRVKYVFVEKK